MRKFKVGDRVRFEGRGGIATITEPASTYDWWYEYEDGGLGIAYEHQLTPVLDDEPQFVHANEIRIIWISLPGADRSYAVTEEQGRSLLRQLEAVV